MAYPTAISASRFATLAVSSLAVPGTLSEVNLKANFATTGDYDVFENVRDFPDFGTPANIVKVPVYGQAQSQSIGAQSDAPDLELTVNLIPSQYAAGSTLGDYVGDGVPKVFQFAFLDARPTDYTTTAPGLGTVPNALVYFVGKVESILYTPSKDDADMAKIALSIQSDFYGLYTQS